MTDKALCWIRQSQGDEDSVSLELQREKVPEKAEAYSEKVDLLDLGNHTGFSIHNKDSDQERIDSNMEVQDKIEEIRSGAYNYLVAWDDTRICRDEYFYTIERACKIGGCEMLFVGDVQRDDLSFGVKRQVETHIKQEEIKKAKAAVARRINQGKPHGPPPKGLKYSDDGDQLVPGEEFEKVLDAVEMRESGSTYREINEEHGIVASTMHRIMQRKEKYREIEENHVKEVEP